MMTSQAFTKSPAMNQQKAQNGGPTAESGSFQMEQATQMTSLQRTMGNNAVERLLASNNGIRPPSNGGKAVSTFPSSLSGGQPLDFATRNFMESRFGHDFGGVQVHSDARGAQLARNVNALAYASGEDIFFETGKYDPSTQQGLHLLAHELTHVVQQQKGGNRAPSLLPGNSLDREADNVAASITQGDGSVVITGSSAPGIARQPQSLTHSLNPSSLSDRELEQEVRLLQQWLSARGNASDPETEPAVQALSRLEAEAHRRHSRPQIRNPILPRVTGTDREQLVSVMAIVDSIRPSENASGIYTAVVDGNRVEITQEEYNEVRREANRAIRDNLRRVRLRAESTGERYQSQSDIDKQHWIVAPIVHAIGRVRDPGPILMAEVTRSLGQVAAGETALSGGSFVQAARALADGEAAAARANQLWQAYFDQIIGAGEMTVTALEYTRNASFITLGVLAVIATGGAAAGAAGAAGTAGASGTATATAFGVNLGVSTTTAVNVIATGAPIVATLGDAGVRAGLGEKVNWGEVAVDVAASLILARFGGRLSNGIFARVAGNPEVRSIGRLAFGRVFSSVVTGEASRAFSTSVHALYQSLQGREITWDQFLDQLGAQLSDPKAMIIDAVMGAVTAHAEHRATPRPGSQTPPPAAPDAQAQAQTATAQVPPAPTPTAGRSPVEPVNPRVGSGRSRLQVHQGERLGDGVPRGNLRSVGGAGGRPPRVPSRAVQSAVQENEQVLAATGTDGPVVGGTSPTPPTTTGSSAVRTQPPPAASGNGNGPRTPVRPALPGTPPENSSASNATSSPRREGGARQPSSLDAELDNAFAHLERGERPPGAPDSSEMMVRVPVRQGGEPAQVLEVGSGPRKVDLGLPPERELVTVTRADISPAGSPDIILDATQPLPSNLNGRFTTMIINNPYGYTPNIQELSRGLSAGGKIIVQGNLGANRYFRALASSELPPGITRTIERDTQALGRGFSYTDTTRAGNPVPNARITFERAAE